MRKRALKKQQARLQRVRQQERLIKSECRRMIAEVLVEAIEEQKQRRKEL